jgi:hypothetical protein
LAFSTGVQPEPGEVHRGEGAVYVMHREGYTWVRGIRIPQSHPDLGDYYGATLSMSNDGTVLAVGVERDSSAGTGANADPSDNSAPASGAV